MLVFKFFKFLKKTFSLAVWFGVIFIRHGLYQDGVFKFTVYIPDNYPDGDCPVSGHGCVCLGVFWCSKSGFLLKLMHQVASHFIELVLFSWLGMFVSHLVYIS